MEPLLTVRDLRKTFRRGGGVFSQESEGVRFTAVDGVSFAVSPGETFAIVGESGCGKTTLARMLLRLIEPDSGEIRFETRDLLALQGKELRAERRQMQMVFRILLPRSIPGCALARLSLSPWPFTNPDSPGPSVSRARLRFSGAWV